MRKIEIAIDTFRSTVLEVEFMKVFITVFFISA